MTPARPDRLSWVLLGALTMIWGASFLLIAISLQGFSASAVAGGRVLLAALALLAVLCGTGNRLPRSLNEWRWCAAVGVLGLALPFSLMARAIETVPTGTVALLVAAIPLMVLVLSKLVFGDPVGPRKWVGFAIGVAGLALLAGPAALGGIGAEGQGPGQIACLVAALSFACGALVVRAMPPVAALPATTASHIAAAAVLLPVGLTSLPAQMPATAPVAALLALGLVQTGLAQLLRYVAVRRAGPVFVSTVGFLIPLWAGFLGITLLGERPTPSTFAAYALILGGVLLARARPQVAVPQTGV